MACVAHGAAFPVVLENNFTPKSNLSRVVPFGRLFPELATDPEKRLPELPATVDNLKKLAETMRLDSDDLAFSDTPSAYTYFGQFVAHDMAFFDLGVRRPSDVPSSCDFVGVMQPLGVRSMQALVNKRSFPLQLDSIYEGAEFDDVAHLRLGECTRPNAPLDVLKNDQELDARHDVPRRPLEDGPENGRDPLIGDPRNDTNVIVSQLHVAFLRAHNALVDQIRDSAPANKEHFEKARTQLRQLYHHVLIDDYLTTIADEKIVKEVFDKPILDPAATNFCLPLEFTAAAFRFGHAMIRNTYYYNDRLPLVSFNSLITRSQMTSAGLPTPTLPRGRIMQWKRFITRRGENKTDNPNFARLIGPTLVMPLFNVLNEEGKPTPCEVNLAIMDLVRGYMLGLPTGQAVADELIARGRTIQKLTSDDVLAAAVSNNQRTVLAETGFAADTPLWFYILAEAKLLGGGGNKLGPVGSAIVAETLIAFVRRSALASAGSNGGGFTPITTASGEFKLRDLLRLAEVVVS